ncbi:MAG: PIN domain-containing protein [ANME-2 cluster archaeon]|nr:PIN domain-containing protein [ANME-2 cluster archaeon]MBC2699905.1 PIN domain-containing protein [ANME-2 cluster archaeon]MBC2707368.1 PIN domain-containing protein [ANME-2 cluster archaeon]MBC2748670.1 PIN domain-containing protein [ANME-2 cluster archaeon]MBC2763049.1 PIN domain-containing protein [ANME-2 cluster archaeon]
MPHRPIESVLFDTSFLLNDLPDVDKIIKILQRGRVSCYISRTIQSEMDDLYYVGSISRQKYTRGLARCRKARASLLDSDRNFL